MKINYNKGDGLVPVIVQDYDTQKVLMLGYMNQEAYQKTVKEGKVTFFSRSKKRLWTKGEISGNFLNVKDILIDCDNDTLLIKAVPDGPVCHTGQDTCFNEENLVRENFLSYLENVIESRKQKPVSGSYTTQLFNKGIRKIAQKVGEEATELVIEAIDNHPQNLKNEAADLIYHLLVLLAEKNMRFNDIIEVLRQRHKK